MHTGRANYRVHDFTLDLSMSVIQARLIIGQVDLKVFVLVKKCLKAGLHMVVEVWLWMDLCV